MKQAIGHVSRWSMWVSLVGCLLLAILMSPLSAEELQPDVNAADSSKQTLDQQIGRGRR